MCSGRVSPHFILKAFQEGADGVLIAGCHIGECHYGKGNYITAKRVGVMKELMGFIGLSPQRLRLEWIATSESNKFANVVNEFTRYIADLGPSPLRRARFEKSTMKTGKQAAL
jgi:F420-non-reducing hydrogenase iron-sulfur subunit